MHKRGRELLSKPPKPRQNDRRHQPQRRERRKREALTVRLAIRARAGEVLPLGAVVRGALLAEPTALAVFLAFAVDSGALAWFCERSTRELFA